MSRHLRPDRKELRRRMALARREEELARWQAGEFPAHYVEVQTLRDEIVARKIATAQQEIDHIRKEIA